MVSELATLTLLALLRVGVRLAVLALFAGAGWTLGSWLMGRLLVRL